MKRVVIEREPVVPAPTEIKRAELVFENGLGVHKTGAWIHENVKGLYIGSSWTNTGASINAPISPQELRDLAEGFVELADRFEGMLP